MDGPQLLPVPNFSPWFDVNTPLPAPRSAEAFGYIPDLDMETYGAAPALNSSMLKAPTPCDMLHGMRTPRPDEFAKEDKAKQYTIGTLLHWCVLEPHKLWPENIHEHVVEVDTKGLATKKAQAIRAHDPRLVVNVEVLETMKRAMDAISLNPNFVKYLSYPGLRILTEPSGFYFDEENMLWVKWRPDILPLNAKYIGDVKTTARPLSMFKGECLKLGYFQQAAWYLHYHFKLTGRWPEYFRWLVVTKSEPFQTRTFYMRNLRQNAPDYQGSYLQKARSLLGLDPDPDPISAQISRIGMFNQAARDTVEMQNLCPTLDEPRLRSLWPAYEQEQPEVEFWGDAPRYLT